VNAIEAEDWAVEHRYLVLCVTGLLLYVAFIGLRSVWYPDEPDIAEVALAMFNSGDWIVPRRMGEAWVDYPPMIYWVAVISSHVLGGMSAFSVRLPNALIAVGIVLMTCRFGTRWFDARTGFWSAFALLIALQFMWQGNGYRPDVTFTLGIASGLFLYAEAAGRSVRLKVAAFACLGFAMLSKGILGLLLPGLVLFLWHGARREWRQLLALAPLSLVSLAVFLPWMIGTAHAMGWDNILYEFYAQNIGRFLSGSRGHDQPLLYYFETFWVDLWPWAILFPTAVIATVRAGLHRDPKVQLLLWWFGTFFVFLTLASTKRQLYLLPAYPAAVLLLGHWLAGVGRRAPAADGPRAPGERAVRIATLLIAIVVGGLGLAGLGVGLFLDSIVAGRDLMEHELAAAHALKSPLLGLGVVMAAAAVWIGRPALQYRTRASLVRTGAAHVAIWALVLAFVAPAFEPTKTYGPQSRWIKEQIGPDETHIGMVYPSQGLHKRGAFAFEMGGTMVDLLDNRLQVDEFFAKHPDSIVIVDEDSVDDIFAGDEAGRQARTLRRLFVSDTSYYAIRGPGAVRGPVPRR
jgi:4-amino-4-deoxy-L-arabinose transferase-like glycosyltransferase